MNFYQTVKNYLLKEMDNEHKVAIIPGSFKPPHKGHYLMVKYYSEMVGKTGNVIVAISNPSIKSARRTPDGKIISAEVAAEIMKIYCSGLPNVEITVVQGSPVKFCYNIGDTMESGILIFGCSQKDNDIKRFDNIKKYIESRNDNLIVMNPQTTAVDVTMNEAGAVSASDFRKVFGDIDKMMEFLPEHLNDRQKQKVIQLLLK